MRLTDIDIHNAIGCRRFNASLKAPVTIIAGSNGAGKTSIIQSIRFALTGETLRISLKKDGVKLVSEGAKTGSVGVKWSDDGKVGAAVVALPECKLIEGKAGELHEAMRFVCDMQRFSDIEPNERRQFMFGLTKTSATTDEVRRLLIDRKADPAKVEAILPLMRAGFPAAHDEAKGKARDAKAAWRAVTGETYGDKKAEGWRVASEFIVSKSDIDADTSRLEALDGELEFALREAGEINGREKQYQDNVGRLSALRDRAVRYARIQDKLNRDEDELKDWDAKIEIARGQASGGAVVKPMCCPHCAGLVTAVGDELKPYEAVEKAAHPEAARMLSEYIAARDLMSRCVENGRRDLKAADDAARELRALEEVGVAEPPDASSVEEVNSRLREVRARRDEAAKKLETTRDYVRANAAADKKTSEAARYHADVKAWDLIADALAPDGIPGELLAQALRPVNHALAQHAADTGWAQVTVDADMEIRAGGRPYLLLSESEQWRTDAMLTAAIAQLSWLRMMLFDRLDVLDMQGRSDALGWLATMAEEGDIETCVVAATLKSLPEGLPKNTFDCYWIQSGSAASDMKAA